MRKESEVTLNTKISIKKTFIPLKNTAYHYYGDKTHSTVLYREQ